MGNLDVFMNAIRYVNIAKQRAGSNRCSVAHRFIGSLVDPSPRDYVNIIALSRFYRRQSRVMAAAA